MTEKERLIANASAYLTWGDLDKPFHLPECECDRCEEWRRQKGRPTHKELHELTARPCCGPVEE